MHFLYSAVLVAACLIAVILFIWALMSDNGGFGLNPWIAIAAGLSVWVILMWVFGSIPHWFIFQHYPGWLVSVTLIVLILTVALVIIRFAPVAEILVVLLILAMVGYGLTNVTLSSHSKSATSPTSTTLTTATTQPTTTTTVPAKKPKPTHAQKVAAQIAAADKAARKRGYQAGPQTPANPHGVDCLDGCVMFGGLKGNNAAEVFTDLQAKLTRSPRASDFAARVVSQCPGYPAYKDTRPIDNAGKFQDDLNIVFGFFVGAHAQLMVTPKGTMVWNSVDTPKGIIQFQQVLTRDRQTLVITKGKCSFEVFTTCGNGITPQRVTSVPATSKPPVQINFPRKNCPGRDPNPQDDSVTCGTKLSGPDQTKVQFDKRGTTKHYPPGLYEQTVQSEKPPADPYHPGQQTGANPTTGQHSPQGGSTNTTDPSGSSGGVGPTPVTSPQAGPPPTAPPSCWDDPTTCGTPK